MSEDCIFCKIARKEIPTEFVYEDDWVLAFNDINPQAPVHVIIIPKEHHDSILTVPAGDDIISQLHLAAIRIALKTRIAKTGFRLVNNCGEDGNQTVHHLHYHLLGGRPLLWPPG